MTRQDYLPLTEKIRTLISTWTSRALSYAGRLQLLKSVIMSTVNFWASAYRLAGQCIKETEQLCSAFLWTGPELKSTGAKLSWKMVCTLKEEGGLVLRSLKEMNMVNGLKLIWRMLCADSLWGQWKGVLSDILGDRGIIDMGIRRVASVEEALQNQRRRRRHRNSLLNAIEQELDSLRGNVIQEDDVDLWRHHTGFKKKFSSSDTWRQVKVEKPQCQWTHGVWFSQGTPKYAFITWLVMLNRLSTMDRVMSWNASVYDACVLCNNAPETRNHLFFDCSFSSQLWKNITIGILQGSFTTEWDKLQVIIMDKQMDPKKLFCIRYAFQSVIHTLWRERNKRRHGENPMSMQVLEKFIDKSIRNKLSLVSAKGGKGCGILQYWFWTR
ncbi:hypothetical protein N665_0013s0012 [Sinapis alba]|nr:hypothetical protein N665_0013s0012 [Sinapis alba]